MTASEPLLQLSSAQIAWLLVAMQCGVLVPAWAMAGLLLPGERRAALWCAVHSAGFALGVSLLVLGLHTAEPAPLAVGNLLVMAGALAMQRALWTFAGQNAWPRTQLAVLAATALLSALGNWYAAHFGLLRVAGVAALFSAVLAWSARDMWRHLRREGHALLAWPCVAPLAIGSGMFMLRAVRALLLPPAQVLQEVALRDTGYNLAWSALGLAAALAGQVVLVGLLVARMVGRLERLSHHDALTGLLNRRAIEQLLQQEEHRVRRLDGRMAVLMLDIDHFKRINDSFGHAAGDHALQHAAAVMAANLRQIDHVARWGGEEFLAMLPATGGDDAMLLAERLQERVRAVPAVVDGQRLPMSVSIGVASWQGAGDSREAMLTRADEALYQAKRGGRACVRRSAAEPAGGVAPHLPPASAA